MISRTLRWFCDRSVMIGWIALGAVILSILAADAILPGIIAESYAGSGPGRLAAFFESRRSRHSLEHYLHLWSNFRNACLIAGGAFGVVLVRTGRAIRGPGMRAAFVVFSATFLAMTVLWGPRQDYVAHLKIWDEVSAGRDPWWIQPDSGIVLNAYGPLFEMLAPLASVNPLAPKILFAAGYLIYAVTMIRMAQRLDPISARGVRLLMLWLAGPFFWLEIAFYGHFDVLAALSVVGALGAFGNGSMILAGTLVGLGFLLKFVPAVLVPFLAIERNEGRGFRIHGRFLWASIAVMAGGMAIAWGIWGPSTFRPLAFVSTRGSSLLSVWRYLKGPYSILGGNGHAAPDLDRFATPTLLFVLGLVWAISKWRNFRPVHSVMCALLTTLTFYRVGFVQYQMFLFLILPLWSFAYRESLAAWAGLRYSLIAYVVWITTFDLFDNAVGGIVGFERPWAWLEEWVGLPNFLLGMWLISNLIRLKEKDSSNENES